MYLNDVKDNIRSIRKSKYISQKEMAERLGMDRTAYGRIENGKTQLINNRLYKIAEELSTTPEKLLFGSGTSGENVIIIREEYELKLKEMEARYQRELKARDEKLAIQSELIAQLKDRLKDKTEVVNMLKREKKSSGKK